MLVLERHFEAISRHLNAKAEAMREKGKPQIEIRIRERLRYIEKAVEFMVEDDMPPLEIRTCDFDFDFDDGYATERG